MNFNLILMAKNLINQPAKEEILNWYLNQPELKGLKINNHIHSPYSFSAFTSLEEAFTLAAEEKINALGLNDFFVTDGYQEFWQRAADHRIFPLFNIELIGLLADEQQKKIRINDPQNPGRIYFSGKGLDYPFHLSFFNRRKIKRLVKNSQLQVQKMIHKTNEILHTIDRSLKLDYVDIKAELAQNLVRERHIAKALRIALYRHFHSMEDRRQFLKYLYGGKESQVNLEDHTALENEIRNNLLKAGGQAFVEEEADTFLPLKEIISIIRDAGGIPCYPVLLDDRNGRFTEFEADRELLCARLRDLNIHCIELIPGRNKRSILEDFVRFFHEQNFIISFGTEHNTPEMMPLSISASGGEPISDEINAIATDGACLIAAHQYLRATGHQGYIYQCGTWAIDKKEEMIQFGKALIHYFNANPVNH